MFECVKVSLRSVAMQARSKSVGWQIVTLAHSACCSNVGQVRVLHRVAHHRRAAAGVESALPCLAAGWQQVATAPAPPHRCACRRQQAAAQQRQRQVAEQAPWLGSPWAAQRQGCWLVLGLHQRLGYWRTRLHRKAEYVRQVTMRTAVSRRWCLPAMSYKLSP